MAFTLQPATKNDFIDREGILNEMLSTLRDENTRIGFALVGPRRMGKTSILKEVARRLENEKNIAPLYFSLWDLTENTILEFCSRLTLSIVDAFKPYLSIKFRIKELVRVPAGKIFDVLRSMNLKVTLFDDMEIALRMGKAGKTEHNTLLENVFAFGNQMAQENHVRLVMMLDEFPAVMDLKNRVKLGETIIRKIRTIHEGLTDTVLCISGSIRKTMEIAALSPTSAFYRQFVIKNIGPFDKESVREMLEKNLSTKVRTDAVDRIYYHTGGIPFYLQFIGRRLQLSKDMDISEVDSIFEEFLKEEADILFLEEIKGFSNKERLILFQMAYNDLKTPSEIQRQIQESTNIISRYLNYFLLKGVLEKKAKGVYVFTDPIFKTWLKRRFVPTYL